MIGLWIYLAGVALVLALVAHAHRMRVEEDGPDPAAPWWALLAVVGIALAWPLLVVVFGILALVGLPASW